MAVKLNSTGGGSVTLDSPSTASNYTVTLPSAAGTLATTTGTGSVFTNPTINGFTGDTTAITIGTTQFVKDASGNVGIGTSSPGAKLHVYGGSGANGIHIQAQYPWIPFTNLAGTRMGYVQHDASDLNVWQDLAGSIRFGTNNTERMRINTNGTLVFAGGNTAASGVGIAFPATQVASSDANTLDDYEEGTWTPALQFSSGSVSYNNASGSYVKVGRLVTVVWWIQLGSVSSPAGSTVSLINLPFASNSSTARPSPSIRTYGITVTGVVGGWMQNGTTAITLVTMSNGGAADMTANVLVLNGEIGGTFSYLTS